MTGSPRTKMPTSTRLLVLCGGASAEHDVSISSARSLLHTLEKSDSPLRIHTQVISKSGHWLSAQDSNDILNDHLSPSAIATIHSASSSAPLVAQGAATVRDQFDVVFPLIHGTHGEDGTMQGLLELLGIPYIGAGVLASAVCMDKVMSKDVLHQHDIPQVPYALVTARAFAHSPETVAQKALEKLPSKTCFVKPANMGSSVGISKCSDLQEVQRGIEMALQHDRRVIIEAAIDNARELEIALIGNDHPIPSCVGEISYDADFYDYNTKYTDGLAQLHIPARIERNLQKRIADLAQRAFIALDVAGLARVDFFYNSHTDTLVLNELNTLPGLTPTSMFSKLWGYSGMPYPKLIERLVELALDRHGHKLIRK